MGCQLVLGGECVVNSLSNPIPANCDAKLSGRKVRWSADRERTFSVTDTCSKEKWLHGFCL